jgi:hypothetical protein
MRVLLAAALAFLTGPMARGFADDELAAWVPANTNTLAIVRVKQLMDCPLGQKEQWRQRHMDAYASGEIAAPPGVELVVKATEFHLGGEAANTYSLVRTEQSAQLAVIARKQKAMVEHIAEHSALRVGEQYLAQLSPKLLGAVSPANRQVLARWLKAPTPSGTHASAYLRDAVITAADDAQLIIAIDLAEMFEPQSIARWLNSNPDGQKFNDPDALASQFATVQGARLSLHVTDAITGRLKLTFAQPVGNHGPGIAQLVVAWFDESGARVGSGAPPKVTAGGNFVILETALDLEGLRRVMSLIRTPHPGLPESPPTASTVATPAPPSANPPRATDAMAEASGRYYQAVSKLVQSLNRQNRSANDYLKTAMWHENFARQIESLPTDGVDPELIAWAQSTSQQLTALASSLRGVPIEVNQLEKSIHYNVSSYQRWVASSPYQNFYRPWGYDVNTNLAEVRVKQQQAVNRNAQERDTVWQFITEDRLAMAKRMTEKYGAPFTRASK